VANTLAIIPLEAVGFIDWLGLEEGNPAIRQEPKDRRRHFFVERFAPPCCQISALP
jgi:hypothetical protein